MNINPLDPESSAINYDFNNIRIDTNTFQPFGPAQGTFSIPSWDEQRIQKIEEGILEMQQHWIQALKAIHKELEEIRMYKEYLRTRTKKRTRFNGRLI
jgi:hypothetical protein